MGIKDLPKELKKKEEIFYESLPYSSFRGKRLAIDADGYMRTNYTVAWRETVNKTDIALDEPDPFAARKFLLENLLHFLSNLLLYEILPIFVFDGDHPGEKKAKTDDKIAKKRANFEKLEFAKVEMQNTQPLARTKQKIEELRKLYLNCYRFTSLDIAAFTSILQVLGIPIMYSNTEGEKLCAFLCREGYVDAVFSKDTDNLVYMCPLLFTANDKSIFVRGEDGNSSQIPCFKSIKFQKIIKHYGLNFNSFVELCILCGCDFNKNIYLIGFTKSLALIKEHGSIERVLTSLWEKENVKYQAAVKKNVAFKGKDLNCLNHLWCRAFFVYSMENNSFTAFREGSLNLGKRMDCCGEVFGQYHLETRLTQLVALLDRMKPGEKAYPPEGEVEKASVITAAMNPYNFIIPDFAGSAASAAANPVEFVFDTGSNLVDFVII